MALTLQQQYSGFLAASFNALASIQQQVAPVTSVSAFNGQVPFGTWLGSLATCAVNADGTLGTADGSPVSGHPIDPRVYGLPLAATVSQWEQILSAVLTILTFAAGTAVGSNGVMPALMSLVASAPA